ncbi:MAG: alpha/beta fold hydrolase [Chloroflexota bacterium]|nr:alpha/beta fold hydrolase [Chloroflexota bacterium]
MIVDLITITSRDGMSLDAAFFEPAAGVTPKGPVDAMLLIHGSGGNFYRTATKAMAEDLRSQGYACLAINTKGHDTVWSPQGSGEYYGNALEILDNSRHDLAAGIDYLWEKGYRSIGLLGHSMGAVKVGYYAATEGDERIVTVIPISPVRLSYSYYMQSEDAEEFRSIIERADQMEAEDRALELMEVRFPIAQMFSAASYLDKHGPAERYNLVALSPRISAPMLVMGGEQETHTRLKDCPQDMVTAAVNSPRAEYVIIPGGNHSLLNSMDQASATVLDWLASLAPVSAGV